MPSLVEISTPPKLLQVFQSVIAAMFGVQKNEARLRDFTYGKPSTFIIMGIVLAIVFFLIVFVAVKLVLHFAVAH